MNGLKYCKRTFSNLDAGSQVSADNSDERIGLTVTGKPRGREGRRLRHVMGSGVELERCLRKLHLAHVLTGYEVSESKRS